ncbi:MAG: hypothetical protein BM485_15005 [Desulfobulbaceae bacterium DB1]|nr:MAG: hypothetical protein BM485_15005 [Desulfobulbaceae bacterium DB1]
MTAPLLTDKVFIPACVIFAGIICQWIAWRVKLPAILFLLFTGIAAGPVAGFPDSDALFGKDITFSDLAANLTKGWKIHNTPLTEQFTYEKLIEKYESRLIPLFAVQPNGNLEIFTTDHKIKPRPGWTLIAMMPGNGATPEEMKKTM